MSGHVTLSHLVALLYVRPPIRRTSAKGCNLRNCFCYDVRVRSGTSSSTAFRVSTGCLAVGPKRAGFVLEHRPAVAMQVEFGLPDMESRTQIFQIHTRTMNCERNIRFELLARCAGHRGGLGGAGSFGC